MMEGVVNSTFTWYWLSNTQHSYKLNSMKITHLQTSLQSWPMHGQESWIPEVRQGQKPLKSKYWMCMELRGLLKIKWLEIEAKTYHCECWGPGKFGRAERSRCICLIWYQIDLRGIKNMFEFAEANLLISSGNCCGCFFNWAPVS